MSWLNATDFEKNPALLKDLKKYNKPVIITEHGIADSKDILREEYITESLKGVYRAIQEGIDVKGYMHWSLLDNFEWDKGYRTRFGLIYVDFKTLERYIKDSGLWFKEFLKE